MDIYGNNIASLGGVFNASEALFTISYPGFSGVKALVQNCSVQYSMEFRDIYELGSSNLYYVQGRPRGQMSVGRIIGEIGTEFSSDPCNPATINVRGMSGSKCGAAAEINYTLHNAVVVDYGFSISVEDMMIRENMAFKFSHLSKG